MKKIPESKSLYPFFDYYEDDEKAEIEYRQVSMITLWNKLHLDRQIENSEG